jgi:hypothetical protein
MAKAPAKKATPRAKARVSDRLKRLIAKRKELRAAFRKIINPINRKIADERSVQAVVGKPPRPVVEPEAPEVPPAE